MTVYKPVSIGKSSGHHDNVFKINMGGSQSGTMGHILARYEHGRSWGQRPWPQLKGQWGLASSSSRPLCKAPPQSAGRSSFTPSLPPCDPVRRCQEMRCQEMRCQGVRCQEMRCRQGCSEPWKVPLSVHPACPLPSTANSPFTWLLVWDVIAL